MITPSLSSPILRGITRDTVIDLLKDMGREVQEVSFTRDALYIAVMMVLQCLRLKHPNQ